MSRQFPSWPPEGWIIPAGSSIMLAGHVVRTQAQLGPAPFSVMTVKLTVDDEPFEIGSVGQAEALILFFRLAGLDRVLPTAEESP
jgi:uncharacterized membrane protein YczE